MKIYKIIQQKTSDTDYSYEFGLNADHPVYAGHFPSRAITPGVLLASMIQDLVEEVKGLKLQLTAARNIKFMEPLYPDQNEVYSLNFTVEEEKHNYKVKAIAHIGKKPYFKLSATFEPRN